MNFRLIAAVLAFVLCFGILCGCSDEDKAPEAETKTEYTGTGETLKLPEIEVPTETGTGDSAMDKFYEEQYADMTPEEIAQFEQDLKDLGMTKEQFYSLMYYQGGDETTSAADTTAEDTTAAASDAETSAK